MNAQATLVCTFFLHTVLERLATSNPQVNLVLSSLSSQVNQNSHFRGSLKGKELSLLTFRNFSF